MNVLADKRPKRGLYPFIITFWFFVIQCLISFVKHPSPLNAFSCVSLSCYLIHISVPNTNHTGSCLFSEGLSPLCCPLIRPVSRLLVNIYHWPLSKCWPNERISWNENSEGETTWRGGVRVCLLQHPRGRTFKKHDVGSPRSREHAHGGISVKFGLLTELAPESPNITSEHTFPAPMHWAPTVSQEPCKMCFTSYFQFHFPYRLLFLLLCYRLSVGIGRSHEEVL